MINKKHIAITSAVLAVAAIAWAFTPHGKKQVKKLKVLVNAGSTEATDEKYGTDLRVGSTGLYVERLQTFLNDLHKAVQYIKMNCGTTSWPIFSQWQPDGSGNILKVTGSYDQDTAKVAQFYLAKTEILIDDLVVLKNKITQYNAGGNKCKYPLSY